MCHGRKLVVDLFSRSLILVRYYCPSCGVISTRAGFGADIPLLGFFPPLHARLQSGVGMTGARNKEFEIESWTAERITAVCDSFEQRFPCLVKEQITCFCSVLTEVSGLSHADFRRSNGHVVYKVRKHDNHISYLSSNINSGSLCTSSVAAVRRSTTSPSSTHDCAAVLRTLKSFRWLVKMRLATCRSLNSGASFATFACCSLYQRGAFGIGDAVEMLCCKGRARVLRDVPHLITLLAYNAQPHPSTFFFCGFHRYKLYHGKRSAPPRTL